MPDPTPPVLERLLALGLTQTMLAPLLGVSQAAISLWRAGKRPFEQQWQIEATVLLAVLQEHLAAGGTLANFRHEPGVTLVGETPQLIAEMRIHASEALEYHKFCTETQDLPTPEMERAHWAYQARLVATQLADWLTPIEPRTWRPTARELDVMRRRVEHLQGLLTSLVFRMGQAALENTDADETA